MPRLPSIENLHPDDRATFENVADVHTRIAFERVLARLAAVETQLAREPR